jgi:hypothetical protein
MKEKKIIYAYYNSGTTLGIIGVHLDNVHHQDGEYTYLTGFSEDFKWIITEDLHKSYKEAEMSNPARFFRIKK